MKNYMRYVIGLLFLLAAIIVMVVLFNIAKSIFTGGSDDKQPASNNRSFDLAEARKSGESVRFTTKGPIVGNEEHRNIRITVDPQTRRLEVIQGYDGQVIRTQETTNTQEAYEAFINALNGVGFTRALDPEGRGSEDQSCPQGRKYNYEVAPGSSESFYSWGVTCSRKQGTFAGDHAAVQNLFQRQIPEYREAVSDVNFR